MSELSSMYWLPSTYEHETKNFSMLYEIDQFVSQVISTEEMGFSFDNSSEGQKKIIAHELGAYLPRLNGFVETIKPNFSYNENIQLFRECYLNLGNGDIVFEDDIQYYYLQYGLTSAEVFNIFLERIRFESTSERYKRRRNDRLRNALAGYTSGVKYIDALFLKYSRLLVLRLDLSYEKIFVTSYEKACEDVAHFLSNRRNNSLFSSCVGYVIKLEYTIEKGHHFHALFFLDGSQSYRDIYLAEQYGEYWKVITEGRGIFHNCNRKQYVFPGIGMVHFSDQKKRLNLLKPFKYFMKLDQSILVKPGPKRRTLWRGEMPSQKVCVVGRPRSTINQLLV